MPRCTCSLNTSVYVVTGDAAEDSVLDTSAGASTSGDVVNVKSDGDVPANRLPAVSRSAPAGSNT